MALKATIFKATLQIADMDRSYYHSHNLTIARHPSENDERMMLRILAFALHASDTLEFTKGLSTENEPDLWQKNLQNEIELWIELGQPDEKRLRKASARASQVYIYTYNERSATVWWQQIQGKLARFENLSVISIADDMVKSLADLSKRTMQLQCTIQDGQIWFGDENQTVAIELRTLK